MPSALEPFLLPARLERLRQAARNRTRNVCVVLDGVHDPHNFSAAVRSCDGFGILDLHVVESQKAFRLRKKTSLGTEKWVQVHRHPDPGRALAALKQEGFEAWVADPQPCSTEVDALPWERKLALVFGNEKEGASAEMLAGSRGRFFIPMFGMGESFNISVAAGITLAVGVRERQRRLGRHGDLDAGEQAQLVNRWLEKAVRRADRILKHLSRTPVSGAEESEDDDCEE